MGARMGIWVPSRAPACCENCHLLRKPSESFWMQLPCGILIQLWLTSWLIEHILEGPTQRSSQVPSRRRRRDDACQWYSTDAILPQPAHECMGICRKEHTKPSQCALVRRTPKQPIPLHGYSSPASSCVALMANCRLILRAKKMKSFKDDL